MASEHLTFAGKDYPTFSLSSLSKKGNFKVREVLPSELLVHGIPQGIKAAPADKIPKDYPKNSISGGGGSSHQKKSGGGGDNACPGSLDECMDACPSNDKVFKICVASCSKRCSSSTSGGGAAKRRRGKGGAGGRRGRGGGGRGGGGGRQQGKGGRKGRGGRGGRGGKAKGNKRGGRKQG